MAGGNPFADDLDYMHARYYNAQVGRFTSFDPVGGNPRAPQSWNRYAYVMGNPLKYVDPTRLSTVGWFFPPVGVALTDFGFVTATTSPWRGTTANPFSGVVGLNYLFGGRQFVNSLGGTQVSIDGFARDVHGFYENRFNQMAVEGNNLAAFIDWVGLEFILPENGKDLGMELAMVMIPGGKLERGC